MSIKLSLQELKVQSFVTSVTNTKDLVTGRKRSIPISGKTLECLTEFGCAPHTQDPQECPTMEPPGATLTNCESVIIVACATFGTLDPKKCP